MIKFECKLSNSIQEKFKTGKVGFAMEKAIRKTMKDVSETSAKLAPYKTGNLRRSHSYDTTTSGRMITGMVKNTAQYWVYVNFGTSKMDPRHFLEDAVNKVQIIPTIKSEFKKNYGGK